MLFRRFYLGVVFSLVLVGTAAGQAKPTVPPDDALVVMITSSLIAYNQGNLTGNYSVLRDLAAPDFREANSPAYLAEIFADMRDKGVDIAPIILFPPKLLRKPVVDEDGDLLLEGFFETSPERVNFFLVYRFVNDQWRLFAIRVTTDKEAAAAPPLGTAAAPILEPTFGKQ